MLVPAFKTFNKSASFFEEILEKPCTFILKNVIFLSNYSLFDLLSRHYIRDESSQTNNKK